MNLRATYTEGFSNSDDFFEGFEVSTDDDSWVDFSLKETLDGGQKFSSQNDNRCGTITNLLILSSGQFDHTLGCWVSNINLKFITICSIADIC